MNMGKSGVVSPNRLVLEIKIPTIPRGSEPTGCRSTTPFPDSPRYPGVFEFMVGSFKRFDSDMATSGTNLDRWVRGKGGFNLTGSALF
jgi:hypothetical protein